MFTSRPNEESAIHKLRWPKTIQSRESLPLYFRSNFLSPSLPTIHDKIYKSLFICISCRFHSLLATCRLLILCLLFLSSFTSGSSVTYHMPQMISNSTRSRAGQCWSLHSPIAAQPHGWTPILFWTFDILRVEYRASPQSRHERFELGRVLVVCLESKYLCQPEVQKSVHDHWYTLHRAKKRAAHICMRSKHHHHWRASCKRSITFRLPAPFLPFIFSTSSSFHPLIQLHCFLS